MKRMLLLFLSGLFLPVTLVACAPVPSQTPTDSASDLPSDPKTEASSNLSTDSSTDSETDASTSTRVTYEDPQDMLEATPHLVGLTDQKNGRLIVRDLAVEDWSDDSSVVWEFNDPRAAAAAGIKFRNNELFGGEIVLFCGPKGAGIISYQTKEVLYFTSKVGVNPHAVELLPDGTFVVGSTTDNKVNVFDAASGNTDPIQTLSYENVHGVLWDPEYEVVWMAGRTKLSAFTVFSRNGKINLAPISDMVYTTDDWLHDLTPCYGTPEALFVTTGKGIYLFNKEKGRFSTTYPCSKIAAKISTSPSVGNFPDNVMALIAVVSGKTVYREWCMNEITVLVPLGNSTVRTITRVAPDDAYYKVRVWIPDYQ